MTLTDELIIDSHPSHSREGLGLTAEASAKAVMRLYLAKLVFNIVTLQADNRMQFEEQLRLVEAEDLEEAFLKARSIGIGQEEIIYREGMPATKWEFVDVADLIAVPALGNGAEIYSQIYETKESREYIHSVHQRGMAIRLSAFQSA
jgi:hypothetical protein